MTPFNYCTLNVCIKSWQIIPVYIYLPITTSFCPVQVSGHCTMGIVAQFEGLRDPLTQSLML